MSLYALFEELMLELPDDTGAIAELINIKEG